MINKSWLIDKAPAIFTGLALVGAIATPVAAVMATPKALDDMDLAYEEKGEPLTKFEVVKATYKHYIPAVASAAMTVACIVLAHKKHIKKETALVAAASFLDKKFSSYREEVANRFGDDTERDIRDVVDSIDIKNNPPHPDLVNIAREKEAYIIWEPVTEQWIAMTEKELNWFERQLNHAYTKERRFTVNDALKLVPGASTTKPAGDLFMWWGDDDYYDFVYYNESFFGRPYMEVDLVPLRTEKGEEVYELHFSQEPLMETKVEEELEKSQKEQSL